jgi:hypothetical protein
MSIMKDYVDEIVFCDVRRTPLGAISKHKGEHPTPTFIQGDARKVVTQIGSIDVLFYRRDSEGEGGSGLFVLGDSFLPHILEVFNPRGGFIITDGSNSRGGIFKKMKSAGGFSKYGWHIQRTEDQPFEEEYSLLMFSVLPQCEKVM